MSGKGDKRRPMDVQYDLFESNWDRIFRRKEIEDRWTPEVKEKVLREVTYDDMTTKERSDHLERTEVWNDNYDRVWQHSCTVEMGVMWIGKNETCNYCGAWEEDGL